MGTTSVMDEIQFSRAKAGLSQVMDEVVHQGHPKVVRRECGGTELM